MSFCRRSYTSKSPVFIQLQHTFPIGLYNIVSADQIGVTSYSDSVVFESKQNQKVIQYDKSSPFPNFP